MTTTDFLVIGGGIIGITIAKELKETFADAHVTLIEKERECGLHASSRNSGVLHAGFYYSPDSLKAKFTRIGNKLLTGYCEEKSIPVNKCGKLVVAKNDRELEDLDLLLERGKKNGIELKEISEDEAKSIEPRVITFGRAIFSPTTSSVDPVKVLHSMKNDSITQGVKISSNVQFLGKNGKRLMTSAGAYEAGYVVNAAGLYADTIARSFGFSEGYRILPFKGLYLYSDEPVGSIKTNIYPVPDLRNPFLGVHFTVRVDGRSKIGPTAIPAFWREQYHSFENFKVRELIDVIAREISLFAHSNFDFKRLAFEEIRKYSRSHMVSLASSLVTGVKKENYRKWGEPGIRAQLLDIKKKKLEMDFVVEGNDKSVHILNAVSPAFTCAIPFSKYICDEIKKKIQ